MKSLVAAIMALTAVFAFTSTTAASAASKEDEMMQRIMERELAEEEAMQLEAIKQEKKGNFGRTDTGALANAGLQY